MALTFPFGQPVARCTPSADGPRPIFVLGAYPSALHVKWVPPEGSGLRTVRALAVDNEPEPFWTGADESARIAAWQRACGWRSGWGTVAPVAGLNGPSGQWVHNHVLGRFGVERGDAWITDCLDTYRASTRMAAAVDAVYNRFAARHGLPAADLAPHPSEHQIVAEAIADHLPRLSAEIGRARPEVIVTLGNAALRVLAALAAEPPSIRKLTVDGYGRATAITVGSVTARWFPLTHPAAPTAYQAVHASWRPRG